MMNADVWFSFGCFAVGLLCGAVVMFFIMRDIVRRIERLSEEWCDAALSESIAAMQWERKCIKERRERECLLVIITRKEREKTDDDADWWKN